MGFYKQDDEYVNRIRRFLAEYDFQYRFEHRRNGHRAVIITIPSGGKVVVGFPLTGSDWRGPRRTITRLRRRLGLVNGGAQ
jgi:hypothetical protein